MLVRGPDPLVELWPIRGGVTQVVEVVARVAQQGLLMPRSGQGATVRAHAEWYCEGDVPRG